jgi:DNA polymerase-3 subunit alpha
VRFGLGAVKNVGEAAALAIIEVRRREGRIRSLYHLCEQLDSRQVNRRVIESLVKAGAMDSLAQEVPGLAGLPLSALRARLFAAVEKALDHGSRSRRDRDQGQAQLFGGFANASDGEPAGEADLPEAAPWTEAQQLAGEKESLGLYWSGHPIERYAAELQAIGAKTLADLMATEEAAEGDEAPAPKAFEVVIGGIVGPVRSLKTRKGDRMAAFPLDDPHGSIEVVAFPETFAKAQALVQTDTMVLVKGKFERDEETLRILASEIVAIDTVRERAARLVTIRLALPPHTRATLEALADLLARHKGDRRVCLELELRDRPHPLRVKADVGGAIRVRPSSQLVEDVERLCGPGTVSLA